LCKQPIKKELVMKRFGSSRDAVTIIEVLFATAIAVFGLVGIASLIGVAGKQASQSNAATISQALANQWFGDFVVRGFNSSPNWRVYNDQITPATALANRFIAFDNSGTLPAGTQSGGTRVAYRHAICIDPLFFNDPSNLTELLGSFPNTQAYRPGLFPYYQDDLNPLSDPFLLTPTPAFSANRPRLLRVGLHDPSSSLGTLTSAQVNRLFMSFDDQVVSVANVDDPTTTVDERDRTAPAFRRLATGSDPKKDFLNTFASNGEYSWFATLCPRELLPTETAKEEYLYTMSLVVTKRRDRIFFNATASGAPEGERIADVTATANFQGGSGGRVVLSGTLGVSNKLGTGDWVMLSRYQSATGSVVVRWFRVISLDTKPTEDKTTGTWTRSVSLDGPDWIFDANFPTQATLVSNVVTVFERVVEVQH
jgi:hypothetical protein